jgi:predicted ribosomally synthesized peptide with SipW-like signal peptide
MNRIFKSLFMIVAVLAIVGGVTYAFFSDTETSTGNTFEAGAIDLTVDDEGHYNGMDCDNNVWSDCLEDQVVETLISPSVNNGGFETPDVTSGTGWDIYPSGTGGLVWSVAWKDADPGTIDGFSRPNPAMQELHEGVNGWLTRAGSIGDQWTELDSDWNGHVGNLNNEPALVKIYQTPTTESGKKYRLSYWYSARPGNPNGDNIMGVLIDGSEVDTKDAGAGGANTNWQQGVWEFTASSSSTEIGFVGKGSNNSLGMFLDDVELVKLDRECTPVEEYSQETCYTDWDLQNLTNNEQGPFTKFYNFKDLKPGDSGENTISLHVTSNDAKACMLFTDYSDLDVDLTDPEVEDVDEPDKVVPALGELGENIYFFGWYDDGDNKWEVEEEPLTVFANGEPILAETLLNNQSYLLGDLPAGQTEYIGLAWCFGIMNVDLTNHTITCDGSGDHNETQTDKIMTSVGFYVEQARNNSDFVCPLPEPEISPD